MCTKCVIPKRIWGFIYVHMCNRQTHMEIYGQRAPSWHHCRCKQLPPLLTASGTRQAAGNVSPIYIFTAEHTCTVGMGARQKQRHRIPASETGPKTVLRVTQSTAGMRACLRHLYYSAPTCQWRSCVSS